MILHPPAPTAWQEHFPPVVGGGAARQGVVFDFLSDAATTPTAAAPELQQDEEAWFPQLRKQEVQVVRVPNQGGTGSERPHG